MTYRLLLDDAASTEGTGTETVTAVVTPPAPDPTKVTLAKADHDATLAELREFRTRAEESARAAREAEEAKAKEKGDYKILLDNKDADIVAARKRADAMEADNRRILETAARSTATRDLATALPAGLADDDARAQLLALLGPQVEAKMEGDSFVTKARDGRSVADFVKAELGKPGFAKFLAPRTGGGTGANGSTAAPTGKGTGEQPKSLGHAIADAIRHSQPAGGGVPFAPKFQSN